MRSLLLVGLCGFVLISGCIPASAAVDPSPGANFRHLPWGDGEKLTYLVSLAGLEAAQGVFTAHKKNDHWEFDLELSSRGVVDAAYPFTGTFWSILAATLPWRSIEYGEYRFEPNRTIKERTRIDYAKHQGTRENWMNGDKKTFTVAEDAIDDVGSMLYHLRAFNWKPGDKRTIFVYESNSEKQAEVECLGRETRAFGTWPAQSVLRIHAVPTKGTRRHGSLMIWITDDARHLPLHSELDFRYGAFDIDLEKAEKTLPAGH